MSAHLIPLALLLTAGTAFGGERVECPLVLEEGAIAVVRPPPGWLGTSHEWMRLTSGGVMRGHPDGSAYLKPARMTKFKGGGTSSNEFAAGEERWLWCSYGDAGAAVQISKRLDDAATECTTTYRESKREGITSLYAECTTPSVTPPPARPAGQR